MALHVANRTGKTQSFTMRMKPELLVLLKDLSTARGITQASVIEESLSGYAQHGTWDREIKHFQVNLKLDDDAVADLVWVEDRLKCSRGAAVAAAAKALHLLLAAGYNALLNSEPSTGEHPTVQPPVGLVPNPTMSDLQARIRQIETRVAGGEQPRGPGPEAPSEPRMTRLRLQGMTKARKDYWVRSQGWGLNPDDEGDHAEIDAHIAELPYK